MRRLILVVSALLALVLYRHLGHEASVRAEQRQLRDELAAQRQHNRHLVERNAALRAEVRSLAEADAAIEELARTELGLLRRGETLFQIVKDDDP